MIRRSSVCQQHQGVLLDFVDRRELLPRTRAALAHVDRCDRCLDLLEDAVLTVTALRRLGLQVAAAEPSPDAWPRLRERIGGVRPRRLAIQSAIAAPALSVALVAVLLAPFGAIGGLATSESSSEPGGLSTASLLLEQRFITAGRNGPMAEDTSTGRAFVGDPMTLPDGTRSKRKEVSTTNVSVRTLAPS